jgi:hypothetical protein
MPSSILAAILCSRANTDGEVFCSDNGGDSWSQIAAVSPDLQGWPLPNLEVATA